MTVKRWVVRRKSDGLYSCSAHGWTPDITLAGFFQDEHLAHLAVDEIKDVIPVLVTIEELYPYNQAAHRDQTEKMAKGTTAHKRWRLICRSCGASEAGNEGEVSLRLHGRLENGQWQHYTSDGLYWCGPVEPIGEGA